MARQAKNDPYRLYKVEEKSRLGFVPYGKCPKAAGLSEWVPEKLRDSGPCKLAADGHPIGNEHACRCVVEIIKLRNGSNAVQMKELEDRHRSKEMRETDQRERQISAQSSATEKLTELVDKLVKSK
jgi:hypothetical protein